MKTRPYVGQKVRLNNHGMVQIDGLRSVEMIYQAKEMVITEVSDESLTDDCETYSICVNQPLINQFMLDNHCVDALASS